MTLPSLYPIIDLDLCRMRGLEPRAVAAACLAAGVRLLQVRQKTAGTGMFLALVRSVVADGAVRGASVIVNDRPDIALMSGARGVHVGQSDLSVADVKSITGLQCVVGVSTHTTSQVDEAIAGPADYVAVGPVFRTATKDTGYEPRGLELVRYAAGRGKPVVAIGGISLDNARQVTDAGASAVAIISDLLEGGQVAARLGAYLRALG
ncbi:MAG TPA: thiamine phosphate synthase [Vicinamibacterales bacterium]|nr:thiamine phosphate synthase [Vicinamibacterales bacterium]